MVILAGGALTGVAVTRAHGGIQRLPGNLLAALMHSERLRPLPADRQMAVNVALRRRNQQGFEAAVPGGSDPMSPEFGKYLSPAQISARFGLPSAQVTAVADYLRSHGLSVRLPAPGWDAIAASGSVRAMEGAFNVHLSEWRDRANGEVFYANDASIALPRNLASSVVGVTGLDNYVRWQPAFPCILDCPAGLPHLRPDQLKTAYDVPALTDSGGCGQGKPCDGSGETVAIFAVDGFKRSSIEEYDHQFGEGQYGARWPALNLTVSSYLPDLRMFDGLELPASGGSGEGEADLDIEMVRAIAPGAAIHVYEIKHEDFSDSAFQDFLYAVYRSQDPSTGVPQEAIVSISYGGCESDYKGVQLGGLWGDDDVFSLLSHRGHSVFVSSGDVGSKCPTGSGPSDPCPTSPQLIYGVEYPASDPSVTAVGGTTLNVSDDAGDRQDEQAWGDSGFGQSVYFHQPPYQDNPEFPLGGRLVPDVAADADPQTAPDVFTYACNDEDHKEDRWRPYGLGAVGAIGGTSEAAPIWAGLAAIFDQYAKAHGSPTLGFANEKLYMMADVGGGWAQQPFLPAPDRGGNALGWDRSGLGSFDANNMVRDLIPTLEPPICGSLPGCGTVSFDAHPFPRGAQVTFSLESQWVQNGKEMRDSETICTVSVGSDGHARQDCPLHPRAPASAHLSIVAQSTSSTRYGPLVTTAYGSLAAVAPRMAGQIVVITDQPQAGTISVMNPDGTDVRQVAQGPYLSADLSPDGAKLVLNSGGQSLALANADGADLHAIFTAPSRWVESSPTWSPSGDSIAFAMRPPGTLNVSDIEVIDPATSELRLVARVGWALEGNLAWSPDGTELAFVSDSGSIQAVGVASGKVRTILAQGSPKFAAGESVLDLSWAPAISLLCKVAPAALGEILNVNPDGSGVATVLRSPNSSPTWGPDGIHFAAISPEPFRVVLATVDGGVQATIGPQGVSYVRWGGGG